MAEADMHHDCGVSQCDRPTQDVICVTHKDELVAAITAIAWAKEPVYRNGLHVPGDHHPGLWDDLEIALTRQHVLARMTVGSKSDETPMPFHEAASDAKRGLERFVWYWAYEFYNNNQHLNLVSATVPEACIWLASFPNLLASHPQAAAMWEDFTREVASASRVVDLAPNSMYLGECGSDVDGGHCTAKVYGRPDRDKAWCRVCGVEHDAHVKYQKMLVEVENSNATATAISRSLAGYVGLKVNVNTIRTWARSVDEDGNPVLPMRSRTKEGNPQYRVGDVFSLARQGKPSRRNAA